MPCANVPGATLLREISRSLRYPFARRKLESAIEYLESRWFEERESEGRGGALLFMDGFDHYEGKELLEKWASATSVSMDRRVSRCN